ncbi:MAG: M20/M25/M40 family metallo-hydrolase [Bacillota bacterium]|nr:M20/M25/M40 family metallo-hydrolase [Bacillota bacterium]
MTIKKEDIVKDFVELTKIDRESFCERDIARELTVRLENMGFQVTEDNAGEDIGGNAGNIYAFLKGDIEGSPILFSCHMDTVGPGKDKRAIIDGDIIRSDGTTVLGGDNLTGILPVLHGIGEAVGSGKPKRDIEILFTVAEEVFTKGAKAFDFECIKAKDAYVLDVDGEPGEVALSAPSIIQFNAVMHGRAAHAGFACEEGRNAIMAMTKAVSQMVQGRPDSSSTFNVGKIEGGLATNIVSETCSIICEARSMNHKKCEEIVEKNRQILQDAADELGCRLEFESFVPVRAMKVEENEAVVKRFVKACESIGIKPVLKQTFGASDGNYFNQVGIPAVVVATGMSKAHSTQEYCHISTMVVNAELVTAIVSQPE